MASMKSLAPYFGVILIQLAYGGSNILCKLALDQGISYLVFIVYRHIIALAILGPLAYFLERKQRPALTKSIALKIFVLALFGTTIFLTTYYAGLDYTSATVASAMNCVIPALTFSLAVILRMEKVNINEAKGRAKIIGALVCIAGALTFTLWKGQLLGGITNHALIVAKDDQANHSAKQFKEDWIKGSFLLLISYVAYSVWLIMQRVVYEVYPAKLSINALICVFAIVQSSALALIFDRKATSWELGWNVELVTVLYTGAIISGLTNYLQTFCVSKKGPVFIAMFFPLLLVIVAVFSAFFLAEKLHLGSLIGALIIVAGLYIVLWGKSDDSAVYNEEKESRCMSELQKPNEVQVSTSTLKDCTNV